MASSPRDERGSRVVMIAVDGSSQAEYAFQWYIENISKKEDYVIIVHCPEFQAVSLMAKAVEVSNKRKEEEEKVQLLTAKFVQKLKVEGIAGRVLRLAGKPGEEIVNASKTEKAQLIVTGTRGLGSVKRSIMGSVSNYVLHNVDIPCVIVRQP